MQQWESSSIQAGISEQDLMEEAVTGLASHLETVCSPIPCILLCGKGNNGNDALWLADTLSQNGWTTCPILSHPPEKRSTPDFPPVSRALSRALTWPETPPKRFFSKGPVLWIDGLLGVGARGAPRFPYDEILHWLNQTRRAGDCLLSIDLPSGIDPQNGTLHPSAARAEWTFSIGAVKTGLLSEACANHVGRLRGIPITLKPPGPTSTDVFFTREDAQALLPLPDIQTHKNHQGSVSVWAGSPGMTGAAVLASRSALHAGCGLVRLFVPENWVASTVPAIPEIMVYPAIENGSLNPRLFDADAILAGPGLGTSPELTRTLQQLFETVTVPLVLDADALNACGPAKIELTDIPDETILTPHPGELQRLFPDQESSRRIWADKFCSSHPHLVLCLKGAQSLVLQEGHSCSINGSGNPGLATAGSGDVLAGMITSLRAQGLAAIDAARLGVFWHGLAADHAARTHSEAALTAVTLIEHLPASRLQMGRP